jgi:hypothetical protein
MRLYNFIQITEQLTKTITMVCGGIGLSSLAIYLATEAIIEIGRLLS